MGSTNLRSTVWERTVAPGSPPGERRVPFGLLGIPAHCPIPRPYPAASPAWSRPVRPRNWSAYVLHTRSSRHRRWRACGRACPPTTRSRGQRSRDGRPRPRIDPCNPRSATCLRQSSLPNCGAAPCTRRRNAGRGSLGARGSTDPSSPGQTVFPFRAAATVDHLLQESLQQQLRARLLVAVALLPMLGMLAVEVLAVFQQEDTGPSCRRQPRRKPSLGSWSPACLRR